MNLTVKLLISLLVAAAAWGVIYFFPAVPLPAALLAATVVTALLVSPRGGAARRGAAQPSAAQPSAAQRSAAPAPAAADDGSREQGKVKWFNGSKGFGFITRDNGEEIFVHFRSIRGEGHRSLRDGQRVSFVVAMTEKGPQAEDVEPL